MNKLKDKNKKETTFAMDTFHLFRQNIHSFFKSKEFSDVVLILNNETINCHKLILASGSPFFQGMFSCNMKESSQYEININSSGLTLNGLLHALKFIYLLGDMNMSEVPTEDYQDVFYASDYLQIVPLQMAITECMAKQIKPDNALVIRHLGLHHNVRKLIKKSKLVIQDNADKVVMSDDFLTLSKDKLLAILNENMLCVRREVNLLRGLICWLNYDITNRSDSIMELLSHIQLFFVSQMEMQAIQDEKLLTPDLYDYLKKEWTQALSSPRVLPPRPGMKTRIYCIGGRAVRQGLEGTIGYIESATASSDLHVFLSSWASTSAPCEVNDSYSNSSSPISNISSTDSDSNSLSSGSVEEISTATESKFCRKLASMKSARCNHGTATWSNYVCVLGGEQEDGMKQSGAEVYSLRDNKWTDLPDLGRPRSHMGCAMVSPGVLWVFGGYTICQSASDSLTVTVSNDVMYLRLDDESWTNLEAPYRMPNQLARIGVANVSNNIYIFGGVDEHESAVSSTFSFNTDTYQWTKLLDLCAPMHSLTCLSRYDGILVLLGELADNTFNKNLLEYCTKTNEWRTFRSINTVSLNWTARDAGAVFYDNRIYILGGTTNTTFQCKVPVYDYLNSDWEEHLRQMFLPRAGAHYFVAGEFF